MLAIFRRRPTLHWRGSVRSDTGPNKSVNEDSALFNAAAGHGIVCDGVGGHGHGDIASRLACEFLDAALGASHDGDLAQLIRACHQHLLDYIEAHPQTRNMATTVVLAVRTGTNARIAWVGDSRAYLLRKGKLSQLSDDHSFVNEKVAQGILSREEAESHPMANLIASSLGGSVHALKHIGFRNLAIKRNDRLILCTDGIHGYMTDGELAQAATRGVEALVQKAIDNNTADNCSAICIELV